MAKKTHRKCHIWLNIFTSPWAILFFPPVEFHLLWFLPAPCLKPCSCDESSVEPSCAVCRACVHAIRPSSAARLHLGDIECNQMLIAQQLNSCLSVQLLVRASMWSLKTVLMLCKCDLSCLLNYNACALFKTDEIENKTNSTLIKNIFFVNFFSNWK